MGSKILAAESPFTFKIPQVNNVADYVLQKLQIGADLGRSNCITDCLSGESLSCSEVIQYAHAVKLFLQRNGFKNGDTLIYSAHHASRLHIVLLGVWLANGVVRASYPEDVVDELLNRLIESDSKWVFCDDEYAPENLSVVSKIPWEVKVIVPGKLECCISLEDVFLEINTETLTAPSETLSTLKTDAALILQTSGTSGCSKGAVFSHDQLLKQLLLLEQMPFVNSPDSPFLLASKMTHSTGTIFPLSVISAGRRVILNSKPTLENLQKAIAEYKVYGALLFPKFLMSLADSVGNAHQWDLSSLKRVATAGQIMKESQVSFLRRRLNLDCVIVIYGLTETGFVSTNVSWKDMRLGNHEVIADFPESSCGKLVPGTELVVQDIETGVALGANCVGEFSINSPRTFNGYLNNPEADEAARVNGWFRTGDLGYFDHNGFIFITGRKKEIFKYFNNHINPNDLEKVLMTHPLVKEAVVVGVPDPNGGDSIPRAFVLLKRSDCSKEADNDIHARVIQTFFDEQVASYKKLRGGLFVLNNLPYGKTGKLLKAALLNNVEPM